MIITILTPTYNRADKLKNLFISLCNQTIKNFEWLIVDDGSTDITSDLVESFCRNAEFHIRYEKQENGGKHRALNKGISMIDSEMTFIVDSDDWLSNNAIEIILDYYKKYSIRKESDKICGFSFLRAFSNGEINTREYPDDEIIDTYRQQRINNNLLGDKAEVYYTDILKKYPFIEFEGEKFMPEDSVWLKMSGPYNMVHANRVIYYSDYLEGGLTKSGRRMKVNSPYGMMYRASVYLNDPLVASKVKIKMAVLYDIYSYFAKEKDKKFNTSEEQIIDMKEKCQIYNKLGRMLAALLLFPSRLLFIIWNIRYTV